MGRRYDDSLRVMRIYPARLRAGIGARRARDVGGSQHRRLPPPRRGDTVTP
jgi:hypothetical protein